MKSLCCLGSLVGCERFPDTEPRERKLDCGHRGAESLGCVGGCVGNRDGGGDAGGLSCRPARFVQAGCGLGYGLGSSCGGHKVWGSVIWCRGGREIEMESVKEKLRNSGGNSEKLRKRVAKRGGQWQPVG